MRHYKRILVGVLGIIIWVIGGFLFFKMGLDRLGVFLTAAGMFIVWLSLCVGKPKICPKCDRKPFWPWEKYCRCGTEFKEYPLELIKLWKKEPWRIVVGLACILIVAFIIYTMPVNSDLSFKSPTLQEVAPREIPRPIYEQEYGQLVSKAQPKYLFERRFVLDREDPLRYALEPDAYGVFRGALFAMNHITPEDLKIRELAIELSKNADSRLEEAINAFGYVRKLRDVAVSIWFWEMPNRTIELGKGDCKTKSSLLVSLLRSMGFNSSEVWQVGAEEHSYVIVWVQNTWLPLDPALEDDFWYFARNPGKLNSTLYSPQVIFNDRYYSSWELMGWAGELTNPTPRMVG
jgi:hypothetical protein